MADVALDAHSHPHQTSPIEGEEKASVTPSFSPDYEQLPERDDDEERAAREWLKHLEAGRLG